MYLPYSYENINIIEGTYQPSPIKNRNNQSFDFWVRSLFHRAQSAIIFNLPDEWQGVKLDFWYYCLFKYGYLAIMDLSYRDEQTLKELGMCFNPVGLKGFNFYYQPVSVILANPAILNKDGVELEIGKDCALVKLTPDFMGIWDIIEFYADKLSNLDNAINMSIINNKLAFVLAGKTKAAVAALKKMIDKINAGNPTVFVDSRLMNDSKDKDTPFQYWQRDNLKQSYLTTDQLLDLHTILNDFDAEVGIPTIPYQKKERETAYESQSKYADGMARALTWERCLDASFESVRQLYPQLDISFEMRWKQNEFSESNDNRPGTIPTTE